jgi:hypothetical protein
LKKLYKRLRRFVVPVDWGVLLLISVALLLAPRHAADPRLLPYWLVVVHLFVLGALAENQSRYSYFVVYIAALYVGAPWRTLLGRRAPGGPTGLSLPALGRASLRQLAGYALVMLLAVGAHRAASALHGVHIVGLSGGSITSSGERITTEEAQRRFGVAVGQCRLKVRSSARGDPASVLAFHYTVVMSGVEPDSLRFTIGNGSPLDSFGIPLDSGAPRFEGAPGRTLALLMDGVVLREIDLSRDFEPVAVELERPEPGRHEVELRFRFGDGPVAGEVETVLGYLGVY